MWQHLFHLDFCDTLGGTGQVLELQQQCAAARLAEAKASDRSARRTAAADKALTEAADWRRQLDAALQVRVWEIGIRVLGYQG
jgi:hypothetical protein